MSSRQVDERVVQMKFDNADFQRKTAETISTLDKLKAALHLDGFKGLKDVNDSIKGMDMSGVSKSVDECSRKFSALEIAGVTAIAKITSTAMDMGIKFVKSMSIDRVTDGFTRYAQKTSAVQTIMAATAKDFSDTGTQMAYVSDQLKKLSWFTDETSYSFNEMVNNIGKFTSNNIQLDQAVTAMEGISTWAAVSGANINDANRAMYNLSQSIGAGSVKLIDWKSIENANMATYDFKKNVAETAVQMGTLSRAGDGVYKTLKGTTFTLAQFNTELDKGWFSSEVLLNTLNKYGGATEVLYDLYRVTGQSTTSILKYLDAFKDGSKSIQQIAEETETSVEDIEGLFTQLADAQNELGLKSFRAAQEAKTFQEAIDATAEAVGSKWMETFEYIFGNYEEAKKLWSGFAEFLYEEFAESGNLRNEILEFWRENDKHIDGRTELLRGVVNLLNLIIKPLHAIKQGFSDAFGLDEVGTLGENLAVATQKFADFTEKIQPTQKVLQAFYTTAKSVAEVFKTVVYLVSSFVHAIAPGVEPVQKMGDGLAGIVITINRYIYVAARMIQDSKAIPVIFNAIGTALRFCVTIFRTAASLVGGAVVFAFSKFKAVVSEVASVIKSLEQPFKKVLNTIGGFTKSISNTISQNRALSKVFASERDQLKDVKDATDDATESSRELWEEMSIGERVIYVVVESLKKIPVILGTIAGIIGGTVIKVVSKVGSIFKTVFKTIYDDFKDAETIGEGFKNLIEDIKEAIKGMLDNLGFDGDKFFETMDELKRHLDGLFARLTVGKILAVAFSIAILALMGNITKVASSVTTAITAFGGLASNINKILKSKLLTSVSPVLQVAEAIALVAGSLALLAYVGKDGGLEEATKSLATIIVLIGSFSIAIMGLDAILAKVGLESVLPKLSTSLISLAAGVGILSVALLILDQISLNSWPDVGKLAVKIVALIALMAALATASALLAKKAEVLSKGAFTIIAIAASVAILAKAASSLSDIEFKDGEGVVGSLLVLTSGLAAITLAASKIKISQGIALLAVAAAFRIALPVIQDLADRIQGMASSLVNADKSFEYFSVFLLSCIGVVVIAAATMKAVTPLITAMGNAALEIALGVFLLTEAANRIKELAESVDAGQMAKIIGSIAGLAAVIVAFVAIFSEIQKRRKLLGETDGIWKLIGMSLVLVSFGASLTMLAKSMETVAAVYKNGGLTSLAISTTIVAVLGMLMVTVIKAAGKCESAKGAIVAMIAVMSSLAVLLFSLGILSLFDWYTLIAPTAALAVLLITLSKVFEAVSKIKKVNTAVIISMVGSLLIVAGSLVILATQPIGNVFAAMVALGAIIGLLGTIMETVSGKSGLANKDKIGVLIAISGALLIAAGSLVALSFIPWERMLPAMAGMAAVLLGVLGATFVLSQIKTVNASALVAIGVLTGCITILSIAANIMAGIDATDFAIKMAVIVGAMGLLSLIAIIATAVSPGLYALSAVLATLGVAFLGIGVGAMLGSEALNSIINTLSGFAAMDLLAMAGGLLALSASFLAITATSIGLGLAAIGMLGFAVALLAVGGALMLSASGFETLANTMTILGSVNLLGIAGGLTALSGGIALLSLVGLGLPIIAGGLLLFSAAISALSGAMMLFNPAFMVLTTTFQTLAAVDLLGIAAGISAIVPGITVLALLAPSLPIVAAALTILSAAFATFAGSFKLFDLAIVGLGASTQLALGYFDSIMLGMTGFIARISQFMGLLPVLLLTGSKTISSAAYFSGLLIGTAYIKGFNDGAGFHSPPERIVEFENTVTGEFSNNTSMAAAAGASGENVGKSWGAALWEKITGVFKSIVDGIKGLFKKITGIGEDLDIDLGLDLSNFSLDNIIPDVSQYTADYDKLMEGLKVDGLDLESVIGDVEKQMGGLGGATGGAAAAADDFSESEKGAGKAAKKTKEELTDTEKSFQSLAENMIKATDAVSGFKSISHSNPFEAYEAKDLIDPKSVIENMKNISGVTTKWMDNLDLLFRRGVNHNLLMYLTDLGIEGRDMVQAFVDMSYDQLVEAQGLFNHNLRYSEENAESLLNSMRNKTQMIQEWGHNIKELIARGLDEGIVKKLMDLGPDSADQVAAFASMTEDQLIEANALFTAAMEISADGAGSIIASFAETGDEAAMEFIQGINDGKYGYIEAGRGMGYAVLNALKEITDQTNKVGKDSGTGLKDGMKSVQPQVSATAKNIGETAVNNADVSMGSNKTEPIGNEFVQGIINGMTAKADDAYALAGQIASRCTSIMTGEWQIHSPSRVTMRLGRFFSEGAAIGIEAGAQNMYDAAAKAADGTVDQFSAFTSQVNDAINLDLNPIITPKLDLSYIRSQMSEINSMFSNGTIGVNGNLQNGDKSSGINTGQQITFTQNNYSPKALSRTEIYRYTHNQLSMAGGYFR